MFVIPAEFVEVCDLFGVDPSPLENPAKDTVAYWIAAYLSASLGLIEILGDQGLLGDAGPEANYDLAKEYGMGEGESEAPHEMAAVNPSHIPADFAPWDIVTDAVDNARGAAANVAQGAADSLGRIAGYGGAVLGVAGSAVGDLGSNVSDFAGEMADQLVPDRLPSLSELGECIGDAGPDALVGAAYGGAVLGMLGFSGNRGFHQAVQQGAAGSISPGGRVATAATGSARGDVGGFALVRDIATDPTGSVGVLTTLSAPAQGAVMGLAGAAAGGMIGGSIGTMSCLLERDYLGDRVPVVGYQRSGGSGEAQVQAHWRRRPRRDGGGPTLATNGAFAAEADQALSSVPGRRRYGTHAWTAPKNMLTAVRFELVRLNERTNDGRLIQDPGFGVRDLPLSFSAMHTTGHGHGEALIDGSLDEVTIEDDGRVWGLGWLMDTPHARLTGKMIQAGALTGNSIELSAKAVKVDFDESGDKMLVDFTESDLSATTCVGTPAMAGCTVELVDPEFDFAAELTDEAAAAFANEVESFVAGNVSVGALPAFASNFSVIEADTAEAPAIAIPESAPPALWFVDPMLAEPTPVRVEPANEQGLHRVFGHVADWTHPHLSVPGVELFAPRSRTNYAYFANREVLCSDGTFAATGVLTHGGPHAAAELDWRAATAHYDNTCHAWADVSVGEDEHGIWIAGYVRPGTDENTVIAARASGLSGDWRRIRGNLEMVGALSVNAAAFPQRRPSGFAEAGIQTSLVSAGLVGLPSPAGFMVNGLPPYGVSSSMADDLGYVASKLRAQELADIAGDLTADEQAELDAIIEGMG